MPPSQTIYHIGSYSLVIIPAQCQLIYFQILTSCPGIETLIGIYKKNLCQIGRSYNPRSLLSCGKRISLFLYISLIQLIAFYRHTSLASRSRILSLFPFLARLSSIQSPSYLDQLVRACHDCNHSTPDLKFGFITNFR